MSMLTWVTNIGSLADLPINVNTSIELQAADNENLSAQITYAVIQGVLPPGLTLSASGVISGITQDPNPANSNVGNIQFDFIIRAQSSLGQVLDGNFNIKISTLNINKFSWSTPAGSLGTVSNSEYYSLQLLAIDTANLPVNYKLISGALPAGMQLVSTHANVTMANTVTGGNTLSLRSTPSTNLNVGYYVFGAGIPASTRVSAINDKERTVILTANVSSAVPIGSKISFYSPGLLQGVPTLLTSSNIGHSESFKFTIRAVNLANKIIDRGFNLTVNNMSEPVIEPTTTYIGTFLDGSYFNQQLAVVESNPNAQIVWDVASGTLPHGVTLNSSTGLLSGYLKPIASTGTFGPQGYDADIVDTAGTITAEQQYDYGPYDFNNISQSIAYKFTVRAFDGNNYDLQTYLVRVISRGELGADAGEITVDTTAVTIDTGKQYTPVLLDASTVLPPARQNSYYAYQFQGYNPQTGSDNNLTYVIANQAGTFDAYIPGVDAGFDYDQGAAPNTIIGFDSVGLISGSASLPGLILDINTGWLSGKLSAQLAAFEEYSLSVSVISTESVAPYTVTTSDPRVFTLQVYGDVNNTLQWITPADLGTVTNGSVSELSVRATSPVGKTLVYSLIDRPGVPCRLPQGLTFNSNGDIAGRVTFQSFSLDTQLNADTGQVTTTTFDKKTLTIDRSYTFTVQVATADGSVPTAQKQFTVKLAVNDIEPYNDLYLHAIPAFDQRQIFNAVISNTEIFNPNLIYRPLDSWFGVQSTIKMLFASGLTTTELDNYATAISRNHWIKPYAFGDIKTAVVLDEYYNVKYEVVYIAVLDPEENSVGDGPGLTIDLTNVIANPYVDSAGDNFKIIYPNTSKNMKTRVINGIGQSDQSTLPEWMTSNQPIAGSTQFAPPIGYVKAVVLAYTVAGASKLIAYRLQNSGINFNTIQFSADRYQVDNFYSLYFNYNTRNFITGRETTFDQTQTAQLATNPIATVNYAVTGIPFDQINQQSISYINSRGGLDGLQIVASEFSDPTQPKYLIFAQQENYATVESNDGWNRFIDAYIGDNVLTSVVEGYESEPFDDSITIPGYLDKIQSRSTVNQRGGVWQITVSNNIISLQFVKEVLPNQTVQITSGLTYGGATLIYTSKVLAPYTVPYYVVYKFIPSLVTKKTTFNAGTTKFFSYKDQYYAPGSQDKYIKFPQDGAFK
jgi:hypothetical protein